MDKVLLIMSLPNGYTHPQQVDKDVADMFVKNTFAYRDNAGIYRLNERGEALYERYLVFKRQGCDFRTL